MNTPSIVRDEEDSFIVLLGMESETRSCLLRTLCEKYRRTEAADDLNALKSITESPDIIILLAPGDLDFHTIDAVRSIHDDSAFQGIPILLHVGSMSEESCRAALDAGAGDVIFGSIPPVLFLSRIETHINALSLGRTQAALRRSEHQLRLIVDSATEFAILTIDLDGRVTSWNSGAKNLLGYASEEICGCYARLIFTEEDVQEGVPEKEMHEARNIGRSIDERWHQRKNGSRFWASGLMMPLRNEAEKIEGFLKIVRDCTEHKKEEEQLHAENEELERRIEERTKDLIHSRDRLRSLVLELNKVEEMERQRIAAELHDNQAQLLAAAGIALGAAVRETGGREAPLALQQAQTLVSESLDSTRNLMTDLSPPRILEDEDLVMTIKWAAEKARKNGMSIELTHAEEKITVSRDWLLILFQSVRELLLNVAKHAQTQCATISIRRADRSIEIEVSDNGCGFNVEEGLHQSKDGFGLLNIQERIEGMGGKFNVSSMPGDGSQMKIILPPEEGSSALECGTSPIASPEKRAKIDRLAHHEGRTAVLLVDDHRILREALRNVIDAMPDLFVAGEASDGVEALEKARTLHPDVVVMDMNMPRMNGMEATRRLHDEMPDMIIIGLSLHDSKDMAEAMINAGAVAYLSKEAAFEALCATVRTEVKKAGRQK